VKILHIIGARPNYMKIAPIMLEMGKFPEVFSQTLVHTGQHYDFSMSEVFFHDLGLPRPDFNLEVGSASHAQQTAEVMKRIEPVFERIQPDWVVAPGDVNSTLACSLVASKLGIKVAHIEAGLRSFDRSMPEEINRVLTDHVSDLLLTPSRDASENLLREGVPAANIRFVGNVMIDTLSRLLPLAEARWPSLRKTFDLNAFILVTLHRPSTVDNQAVLREILGALGEISEQSPILFPVHPRTRTRIEALGLAIPSTLRLIEPLGYIDFVAMEKHSRLVVTDSGGVQEETTYLGIPCLTLRANTERPITVTQGTNRLVPLTRNGIVGAVNESSLQDQVRSNMPPDLWDGQAARRIVTVMRELA
jgi:UDP-N-acetylglucosamine 2-epimerase (non-hydrolysing)